MKKSKRGAISLVVLFCVITVTLAFSNMLFVSMKAHFSHLELQHHRFKARQLAFAAEEMALEEMREEEPIFQGGGKMEKGIFTYETEKKGNGIYRITCKGVTGENHTATLVVKARVDSTGLQIIERKELD